VPKLQKRYADVFLNIPYDNQFRELCLAYICGLSAFGLVPRATLEIPSGTRRLDRILKLVKQCRYSIHDLSRVELDTKRPVTPRFNMPFELGLCVALSATTVRSHTWFVCESKLRRLSKSLSDVDGTDAHIHFGKVNGVFREICNMFVGAERHPTIQQMHRILADVSVSLPTILDETGATSIYAARAFKDICVAASKSAEKNVLAQVA
jgi:hypothetical protein